MKYLGYAGLVADSLPAIALVILVVELYLFDRHLNYVMVHF